MELWDIYDINKKLTGRTMKRNDWNMADGDYHLTVLTVVTNEKGEFLITKRSADKQWAPGAFEVQGGGVKAGETSVEAAVREASEETGLDLTNAKVTFVSDYRSDSPKEKNNYFVDIYHIELPFDLKDVHCQESETDGFELADSDRIRELGEADMFLHYKRLLPVLQIISQKYR